MKCSVVILAWNRPENLKYIISQYNDYSVIGEIIVWNNNKNQFVTGFGLSKVKVLNSNTDFGLGSRFLAANLCVNRCVIVNDDDLLLSEANIKALVDHFVRDHKRIYTFEGRKLVDGKYTYASEGRIENTDVPTEVAISLTRAACFDRIYTSEYLKMREAVFYDVDIELNGEDIVMSYLTTHLSGKQPLVLPIPDPKGYKELPVTEKISTREGHLERRTELAHRSALLFPQPKQHASLEKSYIYDPNFSDFGYVSNSFCFNSPFTRLLIKEDNGIRFCSLTSSPNYPFSVANIVTQLDVSSDSVMSFKYFIKDSIPNGVEVQICYVSGGTEKFSNRFRLPTKGIQNNHIYEEKISLEQVSNEKSGQVTISRLILFLHGAVNSELCFPEISVS